MNREKVNEEALIIYSFSWTAALLHLSIPTHLMDQRAMAAQNQQTTVQNQQEPQTLQCS